MTIRHVVSWQLATTDAGEKAEQAARVVSGLQSLVGVVTEIRTLNAGTDVVGNGNWDVVMVSEFDDVAALERYQVHPEHQKVADYIRSVVAQRSAVDYVVG
ncbi:Dabb family protein [Glaciibacter superstes]|uniref:Dabb family protein n=1 Tax=Glaciibacter superstes TaxID=501023 RepID=UPI0003B6CD2E|nr:Dabb family protein [Glaciibacter superstes]